MYQGAHPVSVGEHLVSGPPVVVPPAVGLEVHVRQLPDLARIVDAALQAAGLLLFAHLEPVLDEDDARVDHRLLDCGQHGEEALRLLFGAEAHDALDPGPVVPAAVEDDDLPRGGEVRDVALHVHLGLLALGRRGQRHDPEDAGAHPLGDRLDRAALAGAVAALEDDADLRAGRLHPLLEGDELGVERAQLPLVGLALHLPFWLGLCLRIVMTALLLGHLTHLRAPGPVGGLPSSASTRRPAQCRTLRVSRVRPA
jgi:hypothetical protein